MARPVGDNLLPHIENFKAVLLLLKLYLHLGFLQKKDIDSAFLERNFDILQQPPTFRSSSKQTDREAWTQALRNSIVRKLDEMNPPNPNPNAGNPNELELAGVPNTITVAEQLNILQSPGMQANPQLRADAMALMQMQMVMQQNMFAIQTIRSNVRIGNENIRANGRSVNENIRANGRSVNENIRSNVRSGNENVARFAYRGFATGAVAGVAGASSTLTAGGDAANAIVPAPFGNVLLGVGGDGEIEAVAAASESSASESASESASGSGSVGGRSNEELVQDFLDMEEQRVAGDLGGENAIQVARERFDALYREGQAERQAEEYQESLFNARRRDGGSSLLSPARGGQRRRSHSSPPEIDRWVASPEH